MCSDHSSEKTKLLPQRICNLKLFFFSFQHHLSVIFSLPFSHLKAGHMNTGYTTLKNPLSNIKYHGKKKNKSLTPSCPTCCRYGSVSSSRTIKNSRLVSQKDDVHVCIMCLRAVMNYQVPVAPVEHSSSTQIIEMVCVYVRVLVFTDHILFSRSFSCSMASTW